MGSCSQSGPVLNSLSSWLTIHHRPMRADSTYTSFIPECPGPLHVPEMSLSPLCYLENAYFSLRPNSNVYYSELLFLIKVFLFSLCSFNEHSTLASFCHLQQWHCVVITVYLHLSLDSELLKGRDHVYTGSPVIDLGTQDSVSCMFALLPPKLRVTLGHPSARLSFF